MGRKSHIFHKYQSVICISVCALMAGELHADTKPFSRYGLIQGVQNYSSNPFWSPNAPYNMRMPVPVYVNGPDVKTDECQALVADLVSVTCAQMNNCRGTKLSDVRPSVMLQLSQMSGDRNYATACMGYIDWAYNEYMKSNSINKNATFPTYAVPNPMVATSATTKTETKPQWQSDMESRAAELASYHDQTSAPAAISNSEFPKTYADVSFEKRIENEKLGYEPFKEAKAYNTIKLESAAEAQARREAALKKKDQEACDALKRNSNETQNKVTDTFCKQCREHDPYKQWCDDKDKLFERNCMSWCNKYDPDFSTNPCKDCSMQNNALQKCNDRYKDATASTTIRYENDINDECKDAWQSNSTHLGPWCAAKTPGSYNDNKCKNEYWKTAAHYQAYCNKTDQACTGTPCTRNAQWTGTECKNLWKQYDKDAYCNTHRATDSECPPLPDPCDNPATYTGTEPWNTCPAWDNYSYAAWCDATSHYKSNGSTPYSDPDCPDDTKDCKCSVALYKTNKHNWCTNYYNGMINYTNRVTECADENAIPTI